MGDESKFRSISQRGLGPDGGVKTAASLTDGNRGDLFVLLGCQIPHESTGIVAGYRAHQHWGTGLYLEGRCNAFGMVQGV